MSLLKLSFFSWSTDVLSLSLIVMTLSISIMLLCNTNSNDFLYKTYKKNWHTSYINDLKTFNDRETCPSEYEQITFGQWSGFSGESCYCENPYTGHVFVYDDLCRSLPEDKKSYICSVLNEIKPINITKYKENIFCVKRSDFGFENMHFALYDHPNKTYDLVNSKDDLSYNNFITKNFNSSETLSLDLNAIIDIKILDLNNIDENQIMSTSGIDLNLYEKTELTNTTFLYIKRLNNMTNLRTLYDLNNFIVDIHLYNHLWCAFLDFPPNVERLTKSRVEFGYKYCNDFYSTKDDNALFYNDDFKRTERINFVQDSSVSKKNFYPKEIYDYYSNSKTRIVDEALPGLLEPVLIYEKYFPGLGCRKLNNIKAFIKNFSSNQTLNSFAILICLIESFSVVVFILYAYLKKIEKNRWMALTVVILLCLVGLCIFISFSSILLSRSTLLTLNEYQNECQSFIGNSLNSYHIQKTNPMEFQYKNDLEMPFKLNILIFIVQSFTAVVICLTLFGNCCCNVDGGSNDTRQVFELRQDVHKTFESSLHVNDDSSIN